jgi:hypothetical protein
MKKLVQEKEKAIALRKKGLSYNEILVQVPVAKSSLSLWLKDLPLTDDEKAVLKKRKDSNITHGRIKAASELRKRRLEREKELMKEASEEFKALVNSPLFHSGIALYWAEGGKRTDQWQFSNSDPDMIEMMIRWLTVYAGVNKENIGYRLYMHKLYGHENCEQFWADRLHAPLASFKKTVHKPSGRGVKKRPQYKGCLRIEVKNSHALLIKTKRWINLLVEYYRKQ